MPDLCEIALRTAREVRVELISQCPPAQITNSRQPRPDDLLDVVWEAEIGTPIDAGATTFEESSKADRGCPMSLRKGHRAHPQCAEAPRARMGGQLDGDC